MDDRSALMGIADIRLGYSLGPASAFPHQRMKKSMTRGNFRSVVPCPNRCHGGGYELGMQLRDHVFRKNITEPMGTIPCMGYQDGGRGRRQKCDYTLQYRASVTYGPGGMNL